MALHLGKKLSQVLSGVNKISSEYENPNLTINISGALVNRGSPKENVIWDSAIAKTNELFNIAKAKKIDLKSLSSRLPATAPLMQTSEPQATTAVPTYGKLIK